MSKLVAIFLLSLISLDLSDISKINSLKKKAEAAFTSGDFEKSVEHYAYLLDTMGVTDETASMNFAHAQYKTGNIEGAQSQYQKLVLSKDKKLKSLAYQQLGVISNDPETLERALSYFKESIKSDPTNDDARYNYELVKKKLNEQQEKGENNDKQDQEDQNKDENKDQENKDDQKQDQQDKEGEENKDQSEQEKQDQEKQDQQKQDQEGQENKDEEGEEQKQPSEEEQKDGEPKEEEPQPKPGEEEKEGDENQPPRPSTADKLEEMNISEEKAKMILEALKNSEIQYIQQNRRLPSKKKDTGKPDW